MAILSVMQLGRLLDAWEHLHENERKVLCTIAERIQAGQKTYGPLYPGKRKWGWEYFEEQLDAAVYAAIGYVDITGGLKLIEPMKVAPPKPETDEDVLMKLSEEDLKLEAKKAVEKAKAEYKPLCRNCGGPRLEWQVYCGAACCAQFEGRRG